MNILNEKHEAVLRLAVKVVRDRGHEGDARLADSINGVIASLMLNRATDSNRATAAMPDIDLDALWRKADKGQYITKAEQFSLIALARIAQQHSGNPTSTGREAGPESHAKSVETRMDAALGGGPKSVAAPKLDVEAERRAYIAACPDSVWTVNAWTARQEQEFKIWLKARAPSNNSPAGADKESK